MVPSSAGVALKLLQAGVVAERARACNALRCSPIGDNDAAVAWNHWVRGQRNCHVSCAVAVGNTNLISSAQNVDLGHRATLDGQHACPGQGDKLLQECSKADCGVAKDAIAVCYTQACTNLNFAPCERIWAGLDLYSGAAAIQGLRCTRQIDLQGATSAVVGQRKT